MLTFEFPDEGKAKAFADAVTIHLGSTATLTHRVVDVVDSSDDPTFAQAARDFLTILASKFGAVGAIGVGRRTQVDAALRLDNALTNVARAANEMRLHGYQDFMGERMAQVHPEDWEDLQSAIRDWKEETQAFLSTVG